jgi:hypothetical protein
VFLPGIRQCIDLNYATASAQTIWEYAPRSRAAEDYTALIEFVAGNAVRVTEKQYDAEARRATA